ncbi:MAG: hypothetical protein RSF70_02410 [Ruthenibacterium sp.]
MNKNFDKSLDKKLAKDEYKEMNYNNAGNAFSDDSLEAVSGGATANSYANSYKLEDTVENSGSN